MGNVPSEYFINELSLLTFKSLLKTSPDLMFVKNIDLVYIAASDSFVKMVGIDSEADLIGKTDYDLFDKPLAAHYISVDRRVLDTGIPIINLLEPVPDENGRRKYSSTSKYILTDNEKNVLGLYGIGRDVTAQVELEQEIIKREQFKLISETDTLTGLLNRKSTFENIKEHINTCSSDDKHALLFIDIDYFKQVNDCYGHPYGDKVLQGAADKLLALFGDNNNVVGRIGGDEFLVFIPGVVDIHDIKSKASSLIDMDLGSDDVLKDVTFSVGVTICDGTKGFEELYEESDRAMYNAKENGRNQIAISE